MVFNIFNEVFNTESFSLYKKINVRKVCFFTDVFDLIADIKAKRTETGMKNVYHFFFLFFAFCISL